MNRIREIREGKNPPLSAAKLAEMVGTTEATISRLETGERKLTEAWMRRIAKALKVHPADLLELATLAEFEMEVEPYERHDLADMVRPLRNIGFAYYKVTSDAVSRLGIGPDAVVLVDARTERLESVTTGEIVVARVTNPKTDEPAMLIVRQYVAPDILVTNRDSANIALTMGNAGLDVAICGVVVPDQPHRP